MASLHPAAERVPEPLIEVLAGELEGAGAATRIAGVDGEVPVALVPGSGWSACARLLAAALASDQRLAGAPVTVRAHRDGWSVVAGGEAGEPVSWTERALGELAHAGAIAVAAGGSASASAREGRLCVQLTVPAAPSGYQ
jgi:hypothetical protein